MSRREVPAEDLRQAPWIPQSTEEQLNLGLKLINFAYTNRYSALEKEVSALGTKVKELTLQLREAEDKATESELLLQDLRAKNNKLTEENEQMTANLRKLKIENGRLQNLANNIKSTIDANNTQLTADIIESPKPPPVSSHNEYFSSHKHNSRAQQLINQIDMSLQQNLLHDRSPSMSRPNYFSKDNIEVQLTPYQTVEPLKRPIMPKSALKINQFSRKFNPKDETFSTLQETRTQDLRRPTRGTFATKVADSKGPEKDLSGFDLGMSSPGSHYEDGKAFFKEARKLLPFEKFNNFIQQIKLLNKGQKTKEEVVKAAEGLFGKENERMIRMFKQLIYRGKGDEQN